MYRFIAYVLSEWGFTECKTKREQIASETL